ncbi:medium-chain fatty acid-CoA ligase faa2, partial [Spiromyces aspiralis]
MTGSTKYSRELTDYPTIEGETKPRVNPHIKDGKLVESLEGCESLLDSYDNGSKVAGVDSPVLGYRPVIDKSGQVGPFKFLTFAEFKSRFTNFGSGLVSLGLSPGDRCGLYSPNRIEWVLAEMACYHNNIITVPIYDTLGQKAIIHVINEAELGAIVCTDAKAQFLLGIYDQLDSLKNIIVMDALGDETRKLAEAAGVRVLGVKDVEELGEREPHESDHRPNRDEIATICYTSGTTGLPKGVMLTHGNFLSACASLNYLIEHREVQPITRNDVYLSYLPLAHILERFVVHMLINRGARIAFYRGDTLKLMDDVQDLSPTVFVGVPRIFNRIHDKVNATVREKGGLSAKLFHYALDSKKHYLRHGQTNHWFWDRVVFKSLRDKLGGRVSLIVSGSAPISNDALDFLRCSFSANVLEGYGQTETTGACALTGLADTEAGTVGSPFPSCMIKLVDVPDLGYTVKDKPYPRGEICVKGNNVFKGYYKQPEKTLETLDKD